MREELNVNSLARGLSILEVFSESRLVWTPEELMERLGYSRPTLYRYLKTLKDLGYIISSGSGFALGPKIVEMDFLLRNSDPLILHGQDILKALSERYQCTAFLVRLFGDTILCIASEKSEDTAPTSYPRGRPMHLFNGAIGRSIMAWMPRRRLLQILDIHGEEMRELAGGISLEEILERLRTIRKTGYAVAYGEVTPGIVGVASAVLDSSKAPVGAICVSISGHKVDGQSLQSISDAVRDAAGRLSSDLVI